MNQIIDKTNLPIQIFNQWLKELEEANTQIDLILNGSEYDIISVFSGYNGSFEDDLKNNDYKTQAGLLKQIENGIDRVSTSDNERFFQIERFVFRNENIALIRSTIEIKT